MHGIEQGILAAGRGIGPMGGRFLEANGHTDSMEIVCLVFGLLLWAAVMTTLVMGMIALVRHLRAPKAAKKDDSAKS
jgi:hypothetical protein